MTDGDSGRSPDRDVLDGGPGRDRITYRRIRALDIDLERRDANGQRGENDRLTGFEDIAGGAGADRLAGTDGPNQINGGDIVFARGGDDEVVSGSGPDLPHGRGPPRLIDLGAGADRLDLTDERRVTCGPGLDVLTENVVWGDFDKRDGSLLDGTCERVEGEISSEGVDGSFPVDPRGHVTPSGFAIFHVGCARVESDQVKIECGRLSLTAPRRPYRVLAQRRLGGHGELQPVAVRLPPSLLREVRRGRPIVRVQAEFPEGGPVVFRVRLHGAA
jgi:hypothetical protein